MEGPAICPCGLASAVLELPVLDPPSAFEITRNAIAWLARERRYFTCPNVTTILFIQ